MDIIRQVLGVEFKWHAVEATPNINMKATSNYDIAKHRKANDTPHRSR